MVASTSARSKYFRSAGFDIHATLHCYSNGGDPNRLLQSRPTLLYTEQCWENDGKLRLCRAVRVLTIVRVQAYMLPLITRILQLPPVESTPLLDLLQSGSNSTVFPLALVLLPTREYACSVLEQFEGICSKVQIPTLSAASRLRRADRYTRDDKCLTVNAVYGGARASIGGQLSQLRQGCDVLIATPGRFVDLMDTGFVSLANIKHLCIDEVDRMLDMGYEPKIRTIDNRLTCTNLMIGRHSCSRPPVHQKFSGWHLTFCRTMCF